MAQARSESGQENQLRKGRTIMSRFKSSFSSHVDSGPKSVTVLIATSDSDIKIAIGQDKKINELIDYSVIGKDEKRTKKIQRANMVWKQNYETEKVNNCLYCWKGSQGRMKKVSFFESDEFIYVQNEQGMMDKYVALNDPKNLQKGKEVKLHGPIPEY
ncbi:transcriptional unit 1 [Vaprio virus]|uniref:Transcriptional unit 1 n=1 Tax=Vaprio virus TaxID=2100727 RepID=A0A2P1BSX1_9RHAB|nr:transcriptional unit 1 [Vaprio virus]AVI57367.1 transcriptional unit 1 [Vaprio virus]